MQEDDEINLEAIKAELTKDPHITVYDGLIQAARALYGGAIFVDWEWMNDSDELTFAIRGLPFAGYDSARGRWVKKGADLVDVLYRWACNTEGMGLYQLGIFRQGKIVDAGCKEILAVPDPKALVATIKACQQQGGSAAGGKVQMTMKEAIAVVLRFVQTSKAGAIAFVRGAGPERRRALALGIAREHPAGNVPVYLVSGSGKRWAFKKIITPPRALVAPSGELLTEEGGTIFPGDRPVVLLAESFDSFAPGDQRSYCHLADGEGGRTPLCKGSVLLCGCEETAKIEAGALDRGISIDLTKEE